jgi:endonuclease III
MVDPKNVTKFDRTDHELQEFLVYSVAVAGKQAQTVSGQVDQLLKGMGAEAGALTPLAAINLHTPEEKVAALLKTVGIGLYTQKAEALCRLAGLWVMDLMDPRTVTVEQLEQVRWVGPKTARFFVLHSRPGQRYAALDTHILKHLAAHGVQVPIGTPGKGPTYLRLEREFLRLAEAAGKSPAEYDLEVWRSYAGV